jgi:hypothetical protein
MPKEFENAREIHCASDLELGKFYHLYSRRDGRYLGLEEYKVQKEGEPYYRYFKNKVWTFVGNSQGLQRWHIFGPVEPPRVIPLEEMRILCNR